MRYRRIRGVALLLGCLVLGLKGYGVATAAWADGTVLPSPAGAPIAAAGPGAPPVAELDRPEPIRPSAPRVDGQLRPSGFSSMADDPGQVYRAQAPIASAR